MRTKMETSHEETKNVLRDARECGIFDFDKYDKDMADEDHYLLKPGEVSLSNKYCADDPLILNAADLRQMAKEINRLADEVEAAQLPLPGIDVDGA